MRIKVELIIMSVLMFYTLQFSYHALDNNCLALYAYDQEDLIELYKDKSRENLWNIAEKIKIMDVCTAKDYRDFLKGVTKEKNQKVDFRGYDFVSKGTFDFNENALDKLNTLNRNYQ